MNKVRFKFTNEWLYGSKNLLSQNITFLNITWDFNKYNTSIVVLEVTLLNFAFLVCRY